MLILTTDIHDVTICVHVRLFPAAFVFSVYSAIVCLVIDKIIADHWAPTAVSQTWQDRLQHPSTPRAAVVRSVALSFSCPALRHSASPYLSRQPRRVIWRLAQARRFGVSLRGNLRSR